ncbi:MAG: alpha/beta fold hydrolase [Acidobacteriota bacterium]|nr:alpha/beta fold hydrolase [Acidobacteriota bacterium]
MHLFCIPYAGGNAWSYRALERFVSPEIALDGLELPGRGRRGVEPLRASLDELADDVFRQVAARAVTGRYAIYGHSMGALLAYLAAHRIRRAGLPPPEALFLSGSSAPASLPARRRHLLPPPEFVAMLRELGGCPPQVLEDAELIEFFEPILRADFKAVETWQRPEAPPLDLPFVVMVGDGDEAGAAEAAGWAAETTAPCRVLEFSGDHFFILRHWEAIGSAIQRQLLGATPAWT